MQAGIFTADISDHLVVYSLFKTDNKFSTHDYYRRLINDNLISQFCMLLIEQDWSILEYIQDVNTRFDTFFNMYISLYNSCFPIMKVVSSEKKDKPWFNTSLKKLCKKKYVLYRKYIKNPNVNTEQKYKQFRNMVNREKRKCKREYFLKKFGNVHGNLKSTWKVINEVLNKHSNNVQCETIQVDGQLLDDKQEIVNKFNEYFNEIGTK